MLLAMGHFRVSYVLFRVHMSLKIKGLKLNSNQPCQTV